MLGLFGVGGLIAGWVMVALWIAKRAGDRGRFSLGWGVGGAAVGLLGFAAGLALFKYAVDQDVGTALTLLATLSPVLLTFGPMAGLGGIVQTLSIKVADRDVWPVHFMDRGPGTIAIADGVVRIVWAAGSRSMPLAEVQARADGECVRITAGDLELGAMATGKPATRDGRCRQSQLLAERLGGGGTVPRAIVRR